MKRKNSLKRNEEIAKIVQNRKFYKNGSFILYYAYNELEYSRICISASKKLGDAVVRNKVKRQIREMLTGMFDFTKGVDYVIVVRNNYLNNDFSVNMEKLNELYLKVAQKGENI